MPNAGAPSRNDAIELPLSASAELKTRCVNRRSNVRTNRLLLISRVYLVSLKSRPPRMLCVPFTHEKFGCRLNPVVVSLLRVSRPRFWYSVVPPVDVPKPLGALAVVTKLSRGKTVLGS